MISLEYLLEIEAKNKLFMIEYLGKNAFHKIFQPSYKKTWFNPSGALTIFGL